MRRFGLCLLVVGVVIFAGSGFVGVGQQGSEAGDLNINTEGPFNDFLSYLYTSAHWIGQKVLDGIKIILPEKVELPQTLVDPLGILIILTGFLAVAEVAKKVTWFLVVAGWLLILVRVGIVIADSYL